MFDIPRAGDDEAEEIDNPAQPLDEIAHSMSDVARANRFFGGTQTVLIHVARLLQNVQPGASVRVLDIATGSADIPRALTAWGEKRGLTIDVVGVDNMPAMLRLARQNPDCPPLVRADAAALPFAPRTFDIALCALAFHHFGFDLSVKVLREMDALTTRGFVVTDLRRDALSFWGVSAALALMRSHPFTRHDGPLSVRRAFTPAEYQKMASASGAKNVRIYRHWYYRLALVQKKSG